jgi:hypothetical protein
VVCSAHEKKLEKTSKTEVPLCDNDPICFFPNVLIPSSTHPVMQFKFELIPSVEKTRCPYVRTFLYKCVCVEGWGGESMLRQNFTVAVYTVAVLILFVVLCHLTRKLKSLKFDSISKNKFINTLNI